MAIPIHSPTGELLGYAGRTTDENAPLTDRYRYPENLQKELELYNLHRAVASVDYESLGLFLVPDFVDVWRFYEAGFENVAAVMDKVLSDAQVVLLASSFPMSLKIALLRLDESAAELLTPSCAKSRPTRNANDSGGLEADMVVVFGLPLASGRAYAWAGEHVVT